MTKGFYPRLAASNCVKNGRFYFPYLLTVLFTAAAFYINVALANAPNLPDKARYSYLSGYMAFGSIVLGLFIIIFLVYTNSFLMKRRSRELGLYNVLGMGKRNIGVVLSFETLYTFIGGVGGGILAGLLLQKLFTMLAEKLMRTGTVYHFYVSLRGMGVTALFFALVLLVTLLINLRRVHLQKPVELLRGAGVGEREPKTRGLIAVLGVLCLGTGYYLAVSIKDSLSALSMYFVAVILVIIGTYCLFSAVSIAVLKALRKNKRFYYKTGNFIGVSGMLHRMNRNAVGLGNICILCTMVMVMISGTFSLYMGTGDALNTRYPAQIKATVRFDANKTFDRQRAEEKIVSAAGRQGLGVTRSLSYGCKQLYMDYADGVYTDGAYDSARHIVIFLTAADYEKLSGEKTELKPGQVLIAGRKTADRELDFVFRQAESGEEKSLRFQVVQGDEDFFLGEYSVYAADTVYAVLPDEQTQNEIASLVGWGGYSSSLIEWNCLLDTDGTEEEQMEAARKLSDGDCAGLVNDEALNWEWLDVKSRAQNEMDFYSTNGGFFFLGIFLGGIFIMAVVLIMYYRQISEGYEDRARFAIMRQVGLPKREIRRSINMQVLIVFFAPLAVAGVHVAFDFNLMRQLLTLFGMFNWRLTACCTAAVFAVFALLYAAVYALTARTYYNIVSEKNEA